MQPAAAFLLNDFSGKSRRRPPLATVMLALIQAAGVFAAAFPWLQSSLAVAPDAIFRHGEVWRLLGGPLIAHELSWVGSAFAVAAVVVFGWHIEITQGRRRLLMLFLGGSFFAAAFWSVAALVWDWKRPLFSPVGPTALAVGAMLPGLRRPFPAFSALRVPVWVAFAGYAALWSWTSYAGIIDLSAHFLAGLFALFLAQSGLPFARRRTPPPPGVVTTPTEASFQTPEETAAPPPSDPEFDRRVDNLLRKITDNGYDSLSEDEIALLLEASQRYRRRPPPRP